MLYKSIEQCQRKNIEKAELTDAFLVPFFVKRVKKKFEKLMSDI
jgi:hypothetical protein